jgi:hypothetical protein
MSFDLNRRTNQCVYNEPRDIINVKFYRIDPKTYHEWRQQGLGRVILEFN